MRHSKKSAKPLKKPESTKPQIHSQKVNYNKKPLHNHKTLPKRIEAHNHPHVSLIQIQQQRHQIPRWKQNDHNVHHHFTPVLSFTTTPPPIIIMMASKKFRVGPSTIITLHCHQNSHIKCITHPRRRLVFARWFFFYFSVFPLVINEFFVKIIDSIYFMKIASVCSFIFPVTLPTMDCCIRKVIA